jgi:large subunit ribosomal protein L19e
MKLENKKALISRTLGIGKNKIVFNRERLQEIKEVMTKQDVKDLLQSGAIILKDNCGRKKVVKRLTRRRQGSIRQKAVDKKRVYISLTRKLRAYLLQLKKSKKITSEDFINYRKKVRAREFRSLSHMKERILEESNENN